NPGRRKLKPAPIRIGHRDCQQAKLAAILSDAFKCSNLLIHGANGFVVSTKTPDEEDRWRSCSGASNTRRLNSAATRRQTNIPVFGAGEPNNQNDKKHRLETVSHGQNYLRIFRSCHGLAEDFPRLTALLLRSAIV